MRDILPFTHRHLARIIRQEFPFLSSFQPGSAANPVSISSHLPLVLGRPHICRH